MSTFTRTERKLGKIKKEIFYLQNCHSFNIFWSSFLKSTICLYLNEFMIHTYIYLHGLGS